MTKGGILCKLLTLNSIFPNNYNMKIMLPTFLLTIKSKNNSKQHDTVLFNKMLLFFTRKSTMKQSIFQQYIG